MTIQDFSPAAMGGFIRSTDADYATASAGASLIATTTNNPDIGQETGYFVRQAFMAIDLSAYTSISLNEATLKFTSSGTGVFQMEVRLHGWTPTLSTADWVAGTDLSGKIRLAYWDFALDGALPGLTSPPQAIHSDGTNLIDAIESASGGFLAVVICSADQVNSVTPEATANKTLYFPDIILTLDGTWVSAPAGTGELTLPFLSVSSAGTVSPVGMAALTLPFLSVSGTGIMQPSGTGAVVLPFLSVSGTGIMQPSATGALILPFLVFAATGQHKIHPKRPPAGTARLGSVLPPGRARPLRPGTA